MTRFSAMYGMVGIGVVAAIGFVFALGLISPSINGGPGGLNENPQSQQQQPLTSSLKQQTQSQPLSGVNISDERQGPSSPNSQGAFSAMQTEMGNQSDALPTLISVVALSSTGELISEVSDGTQFKQGVPFFVQANFENKNEATILNHSIIIAIKAEKATNDETMATFHGDIASSSSLNLESYWQPTEPGNYVVSVSSMTGNEMNSTEPVKPMASIAIKVVQ
jgi:hypothetical protein